MPAETTTSQSHDAPVAGDPRERGQILVINANGTYRLVGHGNEPLGLAVMQGLVDGYIERVSTPAFDLWVNEEGLLRDDFEPNVGASWLLNRHGAPGYTIVGPAFVAAHNGEESIPAEPLVIAAAITLLEELGYEEDPELRPIAGGSGAEDSVFAEHTDLVEYFQALDPSAIDQSNGNFYTKADRFQPCCVGAHIAYVLDTFRYLVGDPAEHCSFTEGMHTLASDLDLSTSQLDWLLHAAGASADPFSSQLWPLPADVVFTNLLSIETVPEDFERAEAMHDQAVAAYTASFPPIAGGSGEEEVPERWSTADQAQRREALHLRHCTQCEEATTTRCLTGHHLGTVTDAALVAAMGDRPAVVGGGSGEEDALFASCIPVLEYFEQLSPDAIDQENGGYRPNEHFEPCCVGAHLAYFLGTELLHPETPTRSYHSFMDGQQAFRKILHVDHADMLNLLWAAGAHHSPFSNQEWPVPAAAVFRNLLTIETIPTFEEAQELHEQAVQHYQATHPPIAGGSGEDPVGDAIMAVRKLLSEEDHWTRGTPYRNLEGSACQVQNAYSYCLSGAIYLSSTDPEVRKGVYRRLMRAMPKRFDEVSLVAFNDGAGRTHADILELLDAAKPRPPIAGGSIEAGCIGRSRCIVQKQYAWCWAHEPACHAAFCHCIDSTPATEEAYEEQLRQAVRRPTLPAAKPPQTVATVDHEYASTDAWLRSLINGTGSQDDNDAITDKRIALRREWEAEHAKVCHGCASRICTVELIPIAGGSGEEEPVPFVAPTDSQDEAPPMHHFHVETRELLATDRTWFVTARSEDAIKQHGEFNWEELMKEENEELIEKQIHEVEHDSDCPACEGTTPGIRWSGTELPPIAGGSGEEEPMHDYEITVKDTVILEKRYLCHAPSEEAARNEGSIDWEWVNESEVDVLAHQIVAVKPLPPIGGGAVGTPKLRWEKKGARGDITYTSGKYVIFHPFTEAFEKHGKGGLRISKRWRVHFSNRKYTKDQGWVGPVETLITCDTLQEAKRTAQIHADSQVDHQPALTPIAGGSEDALDVEVTIACTFIKTVTITPSDVAHDTIAAAADQAFFDAFNDCTDLAKHDIECDFADAEYSYDPPYPPIAGGSGEEEPRFASCWPLAEYFAALPEEAWNQNQGDYYVKPGQFNPCCVGAHLAYFLHTTLLGTICPHHSFTDGRFALAKQLHLGIHDLDTLLYAAGAHYRPFGPEQWPVPPAQVFANLLSIESVPTDHDAVEMHHKAVHAHAGALPPIAGGSGQDEQFLDDIARDHVAMGTVEVEDIKTCLRCQASVLPWQLQCEGCGSSTPFTPPAPPRWFCTDCGLDDHESQEDAELCCRPPIAGGSDELDQWQAINDTLDQILERTEWECMDDASLGIDEDDSSFGIAKRLRDQLAELNPLHPPIAGGSGDEPPRRRLTTRERRTNRMRRREEWADSRARKKAQAFEQFKQRTKDLPPMGEPIKIGHHSEGKHRKAIKRVEQALEKVGEHDQMLGKHERAAGAIAHELDVSIYDDDDDAIERLQERIDALEAKRTRMKAVNQWLTKHGGIPRRRVPRGSASALYAQAKDALQRCREAMQLTDDECKRLADMAIYSETLGYPSYALSNLSGNIRRQVKRKERLEREAADAAQS